MWEGISPKIENVSAKEEVEPEEIKPAAEQARRATNILIDKYRDFQNYLQQFKDSCRTCAPGLSDGDRQRLSDIASVSTILRNIGDIITANRSDHIIGMAERFEQSLIEFEKAKVDERLSLLEKDVGRLYDALNPDEVITFDSLSVGEGARRNVVLKGKSGEKTMNPVTDFSEAHTNSLALALYLSQRVLRNSNWQMLFLDDPVQSMDVNHAENLISLLTKERGGKQLVVCVHQQDFKDKFEAQMVGEEFLEYEFFGHDSQGPRIAMLSGPFQESLGFASEAAKGSFLSRKSAANALRCAQEKLLKKYLVEKMSKSKYSVAKKRLSDLMSIASRQPIDSQILGDLNRIKQTADDGSHDNPRFDIGKNQLLGAIRDLTRIWNGWFPKEKVTDLTI